MFTEVIHSVCLDNIKILPEASFSFKGRTYTPVIIIHLSFPCIPLNILHANNIYIGK
jgi:hypothetical protein